FGSQPDHVNQFLRALAAQAGGHIEEPDVEIERLLGIEELVEIRFFGQIADALILGDLGGGLAEYQSVPFGRKEKPEQQFDGRGLAGAIGPEQTKKLAAVDLQVQ